jgi:hypothetical protein
VEQAQQHKSIWSSTTRPFTTQVPAVSSSTHMDQVQQQQQHKILTSRFYWDLGAPGRQQRSRSAAGKSARQDRPVASSSARAADGADVDRGRGRQTAVASGDRGRGRAPMALHGRGGGRRRGGGQCRRRGRRGRSA